MKGLMYKVKEKREVYIPELDLCFDIDGDIFVQSKPRSKPCVEVKLDEDTCDLIEAYLEVKDAMDDVLSNFFDENIDKL
jgi:hypothetical protein